jgi:hypothetical protein
MLYFRALQLLAMVNEMDKIGDVQLLTGLTNSFSWMCTQRGYNRSVMDLENLWMEIVESLNISNDEENFFVCDENLHSSVFYLYHFLVDLTGLEAGGVLQSTAVNLLRFVIRLLCFWVLVSSSCPLQIN